MDNRKQISPGAPKMISRSVSTEESLKMLYEQHEMAKKIQKQKEEQKAVTAAVEKEIEADKLAKVSAIVDDRDPSPNVVSAPINIPVRRHASFVNRLRDHLFTSMQREQDEAIRKSNIEAENKMKGLNK